MPHTHRPDGPVCTHRTKKDCDEAFSEWQASRQVTLAALIVEKGHDHYFKSDTTVFGQLVGLVAGRRTDILNDEGNPSQAAWVLRLRRALARRQAAQEGSDAST